MIFSQNPSFHSRAAQRLYINFKPPIRKPSVFLTETCDHVSTKKLVLCPSKILGPQKKSLDHSTIPCISCFHAPGKHAPATRPFNLLALKVAPFGGPFVLEKKSFHSLPQKDLWNGTDSVKLQHPIHL